MTTLTSTARMLGLMPERKASEVTSPTLEVGPAPIQAKPVVEPVMPEINVPEVVPPVIPPAANALPTEVPVQAAELTDPNVILQNLINMLKSTNPNAEPDPMGSGS